MTRNKLGTFVLYFTATFMATITILECLSTEVKSVDDLPKLLPLMLQSASLACLLSAIRIYDELPTDNRQGLFPDNQHQAHGQHQPEAAHAPEPAPAA